MMNKIAPTDGLQCAGCGMDIVISYIFDGRAWCSEECALREVELNKIRDSLNTSHLALTEALSAALDIRERNTGMHSKRVACHTLLMARHFSTDEEWLRQVYWGALLHDVGKIGIPDAILLKEGRLPTAEWALMRMHPEMGKKILANVPFMNDARQIVFSHHERYDGTGYPQKLAKDDIPLGARFFAIADTLDAITSDRPYRRAGSFKQAKSEIIAGTGTQFDPVAVDLFLSLEHELSETSRLKLTQPRFYKEGEIA
ncbi:hypothetical protein MNBD_NITROSPINAE01-1214 [hydrothermal vent metagenome]|uniref:HD-GYP domain-containing protein n=1 Tax=hydrothermal vent metagenome TaxID=652676 RepID=A0A3B1CHA3_9ZZZZ